MISVITVPINQIKGGPYRDSRNVFDKKVPKAVETLFFNLVYWVSAGATLPVHVAELTTGEYVVVDGHSCLDVYRHLGKREVSVIVHSDIKNEQAARTAYISMNYLRSNGWMRKMVILREELVKVGESIATRIMADPELARDLVNRDDSRWAEFSTVLDDKDDESEPLDFDS